MPKQLRRQPAHILAGFIERCHRAEDAGDVALQDAPGQVFQRLARDKAKDGQHVGLAKVGALEGDKLVEGGERVAQAAVGAAGDGQERVVGDGNGFGVADEAKAADDVARRNPAQVEALAAADDGGEHLVAFGGGEDELHVGGRLLKRLQQGIEGGVGEHVHLVEDENLEAAVRGRELHLVQHAVDVFHLVVRGCVEFDHVHVGPGGDALAVVAFAAWVRGGAVFAVERHREDTRKGGLAYAARPDEEVGMRDAILRDGVGEGARDVTLPHDVIERLGAPLSREHFVGHVSDPSIPPQGR